MTRFDWPKVQIMTPPTTLRDGPVTIFRKMTVSKSSKLPPPIDPPIDPPKYGIPLPQERPAAAANKEAAINADADANNADANANNANADIIQ
jgi:hypothetical protein